MKSPILVSIALFLLIAGALAALGAWLGLPCGPSTCPGAGWLYDFQNMIAGLAAVLAAAVAAFVPEHYRRRAERNSQEQRSSHVSVDIVMHASHISAELLNIKETRRTRPAIAFGVHLPRLHSLVKQARVMLQSVSTLLAGPDDMMMLRVMWRVSSFRNAVEGADNLADLFEHEKEANTEFIADPGVDSIVQELHQAGITEPPPQMRAAFLSDRATSR